ncbi:MAG: SUF system Fe-S cluster assembly regulator [Alphaproteobacteria bacterium]|nr:SUF system Fe-S cluster assembly regulator [Alphaproteobacteria bacterium]
MLRLNRMTDYAVVVLGQLSRAPGEIRTSVQIAEETAIPVPTVSKLLRILAGTALVTSHRGPSGGFSLDRCAHEVRVAEIIEALDGPIALTACVEGAPDRCSVESLCPMRGNWTRVNNAIRHALEGVTLEDLLDPTHIFPIPEQRPARPAPSA